MSTYYIELNGSATWSQVTGMASNIPYYLKMAYSNAGWTVVDIIARSRGFFDTTIDFELKFHVYNQFTPEDVRRNATAVISNFDYNSVLGNRDYEKVFSNVNLRVTNHNRSSSPANQPITNQTIYATNYTLPQIPTKPIDVGHIGNVDVYMSEPNTPTPPDSFDKLAKSLGMTRNSLMLLGFGFILILLVKRR